MNVNITSVSLNCITNCVSSVGRLQPAQVVGSKTKSIDVLRVLLVWLNILPVF